MRKSLITLAVGIGIGIAVGIGGSVSADTDLQDRIIHLIGYGHAEIVEHQLRHEDDVMDYLDNRFDRLDAANCQDNG